MVRTGQGAAEAFALLPLRQRVRRLYVRLRRRVSGRPLPHPWRLLRLRPRRSRSDQRRRLQLYFRPLHHRLQPQRHLLHQRLQYRLQLSQQQSA